MAFIGRKLELSQLNQLTRKKTASMAVVYGRRRIGKSSLIEHFSQNERFIQFEGLAPRLGQTKQDQLNEFRIQLTQQSQEEYNKFTDWSDAFIALAKATQHGRWIILLDEISWMAMEDNDFVGKLKIAWDKHFKKNPKLILFVCGSVSAWIKSNFVTSKSFYGRVSLSLSLKELPFADCQQFWQLTNTPSRNEDIIKILSVTGGIPKYLEEIDPKLNAEENIHQLAFSASGILFNDFKEIFSDTLERKSDLYEKVVRLLCNGPVESSEIAKKLKLTSGGSISSILDELTTAGFISKHPIWNFTSGKESSIALYRLSDNYLRFYLKYIEPNEGKIIAGSFTHRSLSSLPGWSSIMGLQFENLLLANRNRIKALLNINLEEIICDNPYIQRATQRKEGCQIDYLIQTRFNNFYLCEIKFTRTILRSYVIEEVKEKMRKLKVPKNSALRPVLIYYGDLHDEVIDADFFSHIIHVDQLFI